MHKGDCVKTARRTLMRAALIGLLALGSGACARLTEHLHGGETNMGAVGVNEPQQAAERISAPVVYVALGDSTGVGMGARQGGGYVARLLTRIERVRPGARVVNLCVSGARTDDVLRGQLPRVVAAQPTIITVGIGINDLTNNVPVERFAQNYEEIITRLQRATGVPIVATNIPDIAPAPAVPEYARAEVARRIGLFNARIDEIAARRGVKLVDAYKLSREIIPAHPEFFSADGFHPSDEGYEYWAKMMWPTVKDALGA